MTRATMSDIESGKRRCSVRPRVKRRVEVEPEPAEPDAAKGREDASTPKNGAIKC